MQSQICGILTPGNGYFPSGLKHPSAIFAESPDGENVSVCCVCNHAVLVEHAHYLLFREVKSQRQNRIFAPNDQIIILLKKTGTEAKSDL